MGKYDKSRFNDILIPVKVYDQLVALKMPGESFGEVITKLLNCARAAMAQSENRPTKQREGKQRAKKAVPWGEASKEVSSMLSFIQAEVKKPRSR